MVDDPSFPEIVGSPFAASLDRPRSPFFPFGIGGDGSARCFRRLAWRMATPPLRRVNIPVIPPPHPAASSQFVCFRMFRNDQVSSCANAVCLLTPTSDKKAIPLWEGRGCFEEMSAFPIRPDPAPRKNVGWGNIVEFLPQHSSKSSEAPFFQRGTFPPPAKVFQAPLELVFPSGSRLPLCLRNSLENDLFPPFYSVGEDPFFPSGISPFPLRATTR